MIKLMTGLKSRLGIALFYSGKSQKDIAEQLGKSQQWFAGIKMGRFDAGENWPAIAKALGVTVEWLRDGKGPEPIWANKHAQKLIKETSEANDGYSVNQEFNDKLLTIISTLQAEVFSLRREVAAMALELHKTHNLLQSSPKDHTKG